MTRQQIIEQIRLKQSFLCVGLDTDIKKIPECVLAGPGSEGDKMFAFNRAIIDATAPYCIAYKPNLAFYEAFGLEGLAAFERTVAYLKATYPDHLIIADAKRGDIGNTSRMYARTFFERYDVDALTVAPYMGEDSVTPFLGYEGKWVVMLALTSNKGSQDFQYTRTDGGQSLWEDVLTAGKRWGTTENMMYVVGATHPEQFKDVRRIVPDHFLLVPGVGAQGGDLEAVCRYGLNKDCGLIVNSSRGIIYASAGEDFAEAAAQKAGELAWQMKKLMEMFGLRA